MIALQFHGRRYFRVGVEYYISGRQAVLALHNVAGNLFHHAMEMMLKAPLRDSLTPNELRTKYMHRLTKVWADVKTMANDNRLDAFDEFVMTIDMWEDLRYFDPKPNESVLLRLNPRRSGVTVTTRVPSKTYEATMEDFDEFFKTLLAVYSLSPSDIRSSMIGFAAEPAYDQANLHPIDK